MQIRLLGLLSVLLALIGSQATALEHPKIPLTAGEYQEFLGRGLSGKAYVIDNTVYEDLPEEHRRRVDMFSAFTRNNCPETKRWRDEDNNQLRIDLYSNAQGIVSDSSVSFFHKECSNGKVIYQLRVYLTVDGQITDVILHTSDFPLIDSSIRFQRFGDGSLNTAGNQAFMDRLRSHLKDFMKQ